TPGSRLEVTVTALDRSPAGVTLERIELPFGAAATIAGPAASGGGQPVAHRTLADNQPLVARATIALPADLSVTRPYWLQTSGLEGSFAVRDSARIGDPESPPPLSARLVFTVDGEPLEIETPVVYRW